MSHSGVNRAVTEDGAQYNRLKRPDDFLASVAEKSAPQPPKEISPPVESTKRTLDEANISNNEAKETAHKRTRILRQPTNVDNGQRSMFPGLLDEGDMSDDDPTTMEALAYLRSVRNEASTIPNLLLAPRDPEEDPNHAIYNSGRGDHSVIYEEGTWIARDPISLKGAYPASSNGTSDPDPQDQYYTRLLTRYTTLRHKLATFSSPSPSSRSASPPAVGLATTVPRGRHEWLYTLDRSYPSPSLLCEMSERDLFHGIKYAALSLDRFTSIKKEKSCWIWALLARAPEYGTLDYEKVGIVRDLGHRAGQLGMKLRSGGFAMEGEDEDGEEEEWEVDGKDDDGGEGPEDEVEEVDNVGQRGAEDGMAVGLAGEKQHHAREEAKTDADAASEMDISDEEGEISDDDKPEAKAHTQPVQQKQTGEPMPNDEPSTLEEARARLLAQLGDRLVQPNSNAKPASAPQKVFKSRAEAEMERQRLREQQLKASNPKAEKSSSPDSDTRLHRQQISQELEMQEAVSKSEQQEESANSVPTMAHVPDWNSKATIDMILTVVAECYGQKDLLRYRDIWVG